MFFSIARFREIAPPLYLLALILNCESASAADQAVDQTLLLMGCGSLENAYGPFDYTNPQHFSEKLPIVENYHFNADMELLIKGMTSVYLGTDIDYTLRAFPNHPRALNSMGNLALRYSDLRVPPGAHYSGDCYFQRALNFKLDDPAVRMVYGIFLNRQKKVGEAKQQFLKAVELQPENAEAHYNLGLVYEKMGEDNLALEHAKIAYKLGFPLMGLRVILERKGVWQDS